MNTFFGVARPLEVLREALAKVREAHTFMGDWEWLAEAPPTKEAKIRQRVADIDAQLTALLRDAIALAGPPKRRP